MKLCIAALIALVPASSARALETGNTAGPALAVTNIVRFEPKPDSGGTIRDAFETELGQFGQTIALDRFGPDAELGWTEARLHDGYAYVSERNAAGWSAVRNMLASSLRETAMGLPGIGERDDIAAGFFKGTVGNPLEEELDPRSPVANASRTSWIERGKSDGWLSYGIRPYSTKPYAYESVVVRDPSGRTLLYENLRMRCSLLGKLRFEGTVVVPVTASWQMSLGFGGDPLRAAGADSDSDVSFGISRVFNQEEAFSVGFNVAGSGISSFVLGWSRRF